MNVPQFLHRTAHRMFRVSVAPGMTVYFHTGEVVNLKGAWFLITKTSPKGEIRMTVMTHEQIEEARLAAR